MNLLVEQLNIKIYKLNKQKLNEWEKCFTSIWKKCNLHFYPYIHNKSIKNFTTRLLLTIINNIFKVKGQKLMENSVWKIGQ